jgi:hypothetical protein
LALDGKVDTNVIIIVIIMILIAMTRTICPAAEEAGVVAVARRVMRVVESGVNIKPQAQSKLLHMAVVDYTVHGVNIDWM